MGRRRTRGYAATHPEEEEPEVEQERSTRPKSPRSKQTQMTKDKEFKKLEIELSVVRAAFEKAKDAFTEGLKTGKYSVALGEVFEAFMVSKDRLLYCEERLQNSLMLLDKDDELKICLERISDVYDETARLESRFRSIYQGSKEDEEGSSKAYGNAHQQSNGGTHRRKLPKLDLPKFSGDVREWLPFWSQFEEIDKDVTIAAADKFQYLIQSTVENSDAWKIVRSYPISTENYKLALDNLKERFGRTALLVKVYVRDLLKLVIENANSKETMDFPNMYVKLSSQIRALGTLGVTTDTCASIIFPVVESCLPADILRAWQRDSISKEAKDGEDELEKLMEFLKKEVQSEDNIRLACRGLTTEEDHPSNSSGKRGGSSKQKSSEVPTAIGLLATNKDNSTKKNQCLFCEKNHPSDKCGKADSLSLDEKRDIVRQKRACYACLKIGHQTKKCRAFVKCLICSKKHETIMCPDAPHHQKSQGSTVKGKDADGDGKDSTNSNSMMNQTVTNEVFLQTLIVKLHGKNSTFLARVIVDHGSSSTYVVQSLAEKLKLLKVAEETKIHGLFGGVVSRPQKHARYQLTVSDLGENYFCKFYASDSPQISGNIGPVTPGPWIDELKKRRIVLSDTEGPSRPVDLLLGADVIGKLLTGKKIDLLSGPTAIETHLGWTLIGTKPLEASNTSSGLNSNEFQSFSSPREMKQSQVHLSLHVNEMEVSKLWTLDAIGITDPEEDKNKKQVEDETLIKFMDSLKKNDEDRYEASLPWIEGHPTLPTNKWIAVKCLRSTTEKLRGMGKLQEYDALFKLWEADGMIEEVPEDEVEKYGHVIPHRAVFNPSSTTTPTRPVFNASCKVKGQPSLNRCLEKGPNLLEQIPKILTRFRTGKVGVLADIKKAFQQISVKPQDRDMLRFVWWKDLNCQDIKTYRHCRVVFGVSSSPFILAATLKHLLDTAGGEFDGVVELLRKSLYVDNIVAVLPGYEEAENFKKQANELMISAKFELRDWEIGPQDEGKIVSLLGLKWDMKNDDILVDLGSAMEFKDDGKLTKRKMLSLAHSLYDPLGYLCPFTIIPRLLLQEAWSLKTGWDTAVPEDMKQRFEAWRSEIPLLSEAKVPRWITSVNQDREKWSLHVFVDSSMLAYGVAIFLRVEGDNSVSTELIRASSRVAPLKKKSIPRLELISCTVGARLAKEVKESLEYPDIPTTYWSDSSTAVHWIKNHGNWGVFVQSRVNEIRKLSDVECWRHIPGELNPADLPSRGCTAKKLLSSKWWQGPEWLKKSKEEFPVSKVALKMDEINQEVKKSAVSCLNQVDKAWNQICACATYEEMIMEVAKQINKKKTQEFTREELLKAESELLRKVQKMAFSGPNDDKLKKLRVFMAEDGLIKLKTRLQHGDFEDKFKLPIVLPSDNPVVYALIMKIHLENTHGGVQFLQSKLREEYWIIRRRKTIRKVLNKCMECQRFTSKKMECQPASLPTDRIQAEVPFEVTGTDLTGPLYLSDGRKAWIVVFTCAVYRGIHLELVTSLSTESYIAALRRFISRRGRPKIIYSDNGTNLVGCSNAFKKIDWKELEKHTLCRPIKWKFNPPSAPWWGGWYERLIGIVKNCLKRVLGTASLDYEELETLLIDVESTVNQRPLTYVSEDADDLIPLTPSLVLTGCRSSNIPEADLLDHGSVKKRWQYLQKIRADMRSRFRKEYLGQLASARGPNEKRKLKVGDVVLIGQDNNKRIEWPLGKVEELIPGKDKEVRALHVKTEDGVFLRPIQRIYPMEVQDEDNEPKKEVTTRSGRTVKIPERLIYLNI